MFTEYSYAVTAAPPSSPAVNVSCNDDVVATCELIVGALATIGEMTNDLDTSVAAKKLAVSAAEAVIVQVPPNRIVIWRPLVVQIAVVSLATVTEPSEFVVGAMLNGVVE